MVRRFGVMFVVRRVVLDYQRPARLDEVIVVETAITEVSGARVTLRQNFWRDSDSLAVLEVGLGCARVRDGKAARIPADMAGRLRVGLTA
jgi:acyl-CoA thioester hydrolase